MLFQISGLVLAASESICFVSSGVNESRTSGSFARGMGKTVSWETCGVNEVLCEEGVIGENAASSRRFLGVEGPGMMRCWCYVVSIGGEVAVGVTAVN